MLIKQCINNKTLVVLTTFVRKFQTRCHKKRHSIKNKTQNKIVRKTRHIQCFRLNTLSLTQRCAKEKQNSPKLEISSIPFTSKTAHTAKELKRNMSRVRKLASHTRRCSGVVNQKTQKHGQGVIIWPPCSYTPVIKHDWSKLTWGSCGCIMYCGCIQPAGFVDTWYVVTGVVATDE